MKKYRIFSVLLSLSLALAVTACNKQEASAPGQAGSSQEAVSTQTSENQTSDGSEEETESETETETPPNPYNEDGTRRAWVEAKTRLNVRKEASSDSAFIGSFKARAEIKLLSEVPEDDFYHVSGTDSKSGKEITGYAGKDYITTDFPKDPRIKLKIKLYSQYDDRWKDLTLGKTSKTMYDVGCATCCLTMSENFIKGLDMTPAELMEQTRYTAKADIAWPKDYYWNYNKYNHLQFIYNCLEQGIPVLVNATRKNGSPHWVLVVGYDGDGVDLQAKDFVINDPLPFGRTHLDEFYAEYPKFRKMIYYVEDRALVEGSEEWKAAHPELVESESEKETKDKTKEKTKKKQ